MRRPRRGGTCASSRARSALSVIDLPAIARQLRNPQVRLASLECGI
jgi:hypothetical protein